MDYIKKLWGKIKEPKGIWLALFYVAFVIVVATTLTLVICVEEQSLFHYFLYGISALMMTYFVYTIVIFAPRIKRNIIALLKKRKFTSTLLENFGYRTVIFSIVSFSLNLIYLGFQGILAIMTLSVWYISITVYYLVLIILKGNIYRSMRKGNDSLKQTKTYRWCGIMFIFLTIALSGIIVLIYTSNMYFEYAGLMIYAVAAYTFYTLTFSIINIFKARRQQCNLYIQSIRNINLVTSLVSIVVLQVALFQAFSPESNKSFANGLTGGAVSLAILALGAFIVVKANRIIKQMGDKNGQQE